MWFHKGLWQRFAPISGEFLLQYSFGAITLQLCLICNDAAVNITLAVVNAGEINRQVK